MAGTIKGKDIRDTSIGLDKLAEDVKSVLLPHSHVTGLDLSGNGATGSLTFDSITGTVTTHTQDTFVSMEFTSNKEYTGVELVRTVYGSNGNSSQRLTNQTLGESAISFPDLTYGANPKIEIEIIIPFIQDTQEAAIYSIVAGGPPNLSNCWGYVEKI